MAMRMRSKLAVIGVVASLLLAGCSKVTYDPVSLGFKDVTEMEAAFAKGYHTKKKYDEMLGAASAPHATAAQPTSEPVPQVDENNAEPVGLAQSEPGVTDCDIYAAYTTDPGHVAEGASYAELNAVLAIPACEKAVQDYPASGRLWFQYGRALEKGSEIAAAVKAYEEGARLNYLGAINNLGELYRQGKGVPKDFIKAKELFSLAAASAYPEAIGNLESLNKKLSKTAGVAQ